MDQEYRLIDGSYIDSVSGDTAKVFDRLADFEYMKQEGR
jgi:hypothetical protein